MLSDHTKFIFSSSYLIFRNKKWKLFLRKYPDTNYIFSSILLTSNPRIAIILYLWKVKGSMNIINVSKVIR